MRFGISGRRIFEVQHLDKSVLQMSRRVNHFQVFQSKGSLFILEVQSKSLLESFRSFQYHFSDSLHSKVSWGMKGLWGYIACSFWPSIFENTGVRLVDTDGSFQRRGADEKTTTRIQKTHILWNVSQVTETRTGPLGCSNYDNLDTVSSVLVHSPENKVQLQGKRRLFFFDQSIPNVLVLACSSHDKWDLCLPETKKM